MLFPYPPHLKKAERQRVEGVHTNLPTAERSAHWLTFLGKHKIVSGETILVAENDAKLLCGRGSAPNSAGSLQRSIKPLAGVEGALPLNPNRRLGLSHLHIPPFGSRIQNRLSVKLWLYTGPHDCVLSFHQLNFESGICQLAYSTFYHATLPHRLLCRCYRHAWTMHGRSLVNCNEFCVCSLLTVNFELLISQCCSWLHFSCGIYASNLNFLVTPARSWIRLAKDKGRRPGCNVQCPFQRAELWMAYNLISYITKLNSDFNNNLPKYTGTQLR